MDDSAPDHRPPEEAFALLGNDLRLRIVRALSEAGEPLPVSGLRERVEERDSGRFNYDLVKLDGWFVTRAYGLNHHIRAEIFISWIESRTTSF
ncbi:hypothetical protein ACFO0N_21090 [Halobium salinum]|uniref:DUF7347 domain-containing protein n=1 Tax=Halobium salinum TaxID=1364940 RepID=A0ABD5PIC0_9EURY|nr:hypothetical protein [Halobium salinum]